MEIVWPILEKDALVGGESTQMQRRVGSAVRSEDPDWRSVLTAWLCLYVALLTRVLRTIDSSPVLVYSLSCFNDYAWNRVSFSMSDN